MKVLLLADVAKLGYLGDVVETNSGYARNYLIPQGLAVEPSEANLKSIAKEKTKRAQERIHSRKRLEEACAKVDGAEAVLAAKANEQGVLFGSVTAGAIAANLREQGFEVADDVVQLAEHIKHVGTHSVELKFAEDLKAKASVVVVREGGELKEAEHAEIKEQEKIKETEKAIETAIKEAGESNQGQKSEAKEQLVVETQGKSEGEPEAKEKKKQARDKEKKRRWFGRK